ncbi:hypothetical protein PUW24_16240 [Paenibacillus urinalis]|uniref:Uncharacterized protein n=1 Tax=Paenibacillus urinalis TaxID=521520 RepID=A0ABY7XDT6_9BACL|nr:hypothetical protein [Paenibacillus urinalis]WDH95750.1 hypothetical protein PUW24_16240 [Paenibacillus urinalis]WDI03947.1 hypothetical protein PUW25_08360 [Paenibacillus urinalis]
MITVQDKEKWDSFDEDSFASFFDYVTHFVFNDIDDIVLQGFDRSALSEMEPILDREYLAAHLARCVHLQSEYVVSSNKLNSRLFIKLLPEGKGLEIRDFDLYGGSGLYDRLAVSLQTMIWGVFKLEIQ